MLLIKSYLAIINHPFNKNYKLLTTLKLIHWKINQKIFKLPSIVSITKNIKCICYPDSSYGSMVVYNKWAEYDVMAAITQNLKKDSIYIDVGANIGDTTVIAADYTAGEIYAFEPSPVAYPRLIENINLNALNHQVKAERIVLSNKVGYVNFTDMTTSETSHISSSISKELQTIRVKTTTLDKYVSENNIKRIDFIKIDVEGAEYLVLDGARESLKNKVVKKAYIELNYNSSNYGYKNSDVIYLLKKFGYKISKYPTNIDNIIFNITATS